MNILGIELQGLRSFAAAQSLRFDELKPGLYHVTGRNEVEPEISPNGVGKSTLFKGVFWGCFGEDDEGLRSTQLKNWHEGTKEKLQTVLDVKAAAGHIGIMRAFDPNKLEVIGEHDAEPYPIDQAQLTQKLGMNAAAFLHSMYFAQFAPMFVDLRASDQTAVFTEVLQLELWARAIKAASDTATSVGEVLQRVRENLARLQGQAAELLARSYDEDEKAWNRQRMKRAGAASVQVAETALVLQKARNALRAAQKDAEGVPALKKDADEQAALRRDALTNVQQKHARIKELERDDVTQCPECGAAVSREHVKKELKKAQAELLKLGRAYDEQQRLSDAAATAYDAAQQLVVAVTHAERFVANAEAEVRAATRELDRVQKEQNPYTQQKLDAEERGQQLVIEIKQVTHERDQLERNIKAAEFWTKGFKEIRLGEIRESLAQLTLESNEMLFQLGLQDWAVEFDVERETQAGSVSKGFTTFIRAPRSKSAVALRAYCGGEKQRLRLSITMGFANLIGSRCGVQPNLEMWDEPSQGLSEVGIGDLLNVLAERAQRYSKVILLADHRALDFGRFTGTITVVKDRHGSRIEV